MSQICEMIRLLFSDYESLVNEQQMTKALLKRIQIQMTYQNDYKGKSIKKIESIESNPAGIISKHMFETGTGNHNISCRCLKYEKLKQINNNRFIVHKVEYTILSRNDNKFEGPEEWKSSYIGITANTKCMTRLAAGKSSGFSFFFTLRKKQVYVFFLRNFESFFVCFFFLFFCSNRTTM